MSGLEDFTLPPKRARHVFVHRDVLALQLTSAEFFVYGVLDAYAGIRGLAWPSIRTICDNTQLAKDTVRFVLRTLQARGMIEDTGYLRGRTVVYLLTDPSAWLCPSEIPQVVLSQFNLCVNAKGRLADPDEEEKRRNKRRKKGDSGRRLQRKIVPNDDPSDVPPPVHDVPPPVRSRTNPRPQPLSINQNHEPDLSRTRVRAHEREIPISKNEFESWRRTSEVTQLANQLHAAALQDGPAETAAERATTALRAVWESHRGDGASTAEPIVHVG